MRYTGQMLYSDALQVVTTFAHTFATEDGKRSVFVVLDSDLPGFRPGQMVALVREWAKQTGHITYGRYSRNVGGMIVRVQYVEGRK
jgi:hypothetical protein